MADLSIVSLDTETTGLDLHHGVCPFLVGFGYPNGETVSYEWDVDVETRKPIIPKGDLGEIQERIDAADKLVLHNAKFDYTALSNLPFPSGSLHWDWGKVVCTLTGSHLLDSGNSHDLTSLGFRYLYTDIKPLEEKIDTAAKAARTIVQSKEFTEKNGKWNIAYKGHEELPSAKEKLHKNDMWLPRAIATHLGYPSDHPWHTVLAEYAEGDLVLTVFLGRFLLEELERRGLTKIFDMRMKIPEVLVKVEGAGVSLSEERLREKIREYEEESARAERICGNIAKGYGYDLTLPKGGNNASLTNFVFNELKLPVVAKSAKTGQPSLNASVIETYQATLPLNSKPLAFVNTLRGKRQRDTALSYMHGYSRFWKRINRRDYRLYPSLNHTGTHTLRFSSQNPNEQNISKKENFNLRYCFGPAFGREWWSLDAKNIELRLPAYEAGEEAMIELFERPDDPPYFGSNHLFFFDILHPEKFAQHGANVKKVYASTWYQWTKNGDFAVQYGAVAESGTADRAYHVVGAQKKIEGRLTKIKQLSKKMIAMANRLGYVETMPDKTVDPSRGYPLYCKKSSHGGVLETIPLSYHIQGTAMWWMCKAMIRCQEYLDQLNSEYDSPLYFLVMQVHDELVFDFPAPPPNWTKDRWKYNLPKMRRIKRLMEMGGEDLGIPTPVSCEYHEHTWSEGVSVAI